MGSASATAAEFECSGPPSAAARFNNARLPQARQCPCVLLLTISQSTHKTASSNGTTWVAARGLPAIVFIAATLSRSPGCYGRVSVVTQSNRPSNGGSNHCELCYNYGQ